MRLLLPPDGQRWHRYSAAPVSILCSDRLAPAGHTWVTDGPQRKDTESCLSSGVCRTYSCERRFQPTSPNSSFIPASSYRAHSRAPGLTREQPANLGRTKLHLPLKTTDYLMTSAQPAAPPAQWDLRARPGLPGDSNVGSWAGGFSLSLSHRPGEALRAEQF